MIEKLLEYKYEGVRYEFFRDDRFTLCFASCDNRERVMFGQAFCTRQDEYRIDVGCHVALERMVKNLGLCRERRKAIHDQLDVELVTKETIDEINKKFVSCCNVLGALLKEKK